MQQHRIEIGQKLKVCHVESNQTGRGNLIGVSMAEYEIEPLKVL
jgi:hypothetical protein